MVAVRPHRPLVAALFAAGLALAAARGAQAAVSSFELDVISLVNQERAALGRSPLGSDVRLFDAAEGHTEWMCAAQTLAHIGAGGSTPGTRVTAVGYPWFAVGETIGQGFATPQDIVDGWHGSSPHWTILMSATYRDIGVGYVSCAGTRHHYWTALVANSGAPATPVGPAAPTATRTATRTPTATLPPPGVPTIDPNPTATILVRTATPSMIPTRTPTRTATAGPSSTPSRTPTRTATRPPTATQTRTAPPASTPTASSSGGATLIGHVVLPGRAQNAGTTVYVSGAPLAVTGDDGTFVIRGLVPGYKTVRAQRFGYLDAAVQVSLLAGRTTDLGQANLVSGDVHIDQRVTSIDGLVVQLRYGACLGGTAFAPHVDLDGSGCIDAADLALVTVNIGRYGPTGWR